MTEKKPEASQRAKPASVAPRTSDESWQRLARKVGAQFAGRGGPSSEDAHVDPGQWILAWHRCRLESGDECLRLTAYRAGGPEGSLERAVEEACPDSPSIGREFTFVAHSLGTALKLFEDRRFQALVRAGPTVQLVVSDGETWFGTPLAAGSDEHTFKGAGVIRPGSQWDALFQAFSVMVVTLTGLDPDFDVREKSLSPHLRAYHIRALSSADRVLREQAVRALAATGDPKVVPSLLPLLGASGSIADDGVGEASVRSALAQLNAQDVVDAFDAALQGDPGPLRRFFARYRPALVEALVGMLESPGTLERVNAARALSAMGAVEARSDLRLRLAWAGRYTESGRALRTAIAELEALSALPRAAGAEELDAANLPRRAEAPPQGEALQPSADSPEGESAG